MKIKNKILLAILLLFTFAYPSYAAGEVLLESNAIEVQPGEEFIISINTQGEKVAALLTYLYFDQTRVEYVSGPESSNQVGNTILYTWFDQQGGKTPKESDTIAEFKFKAKEQGIANFGINGDFYDSNGNSIDIHYTGEEIKIGSVEEENVITQEEGVNNTDPKNAYLRSLRINEEGLNPNFQKDIFEYYFLADNTMNQLQITAVPENQEAQVKVSGNEQLKEGLNKIEIEVISQDQTNKSLYEILVTKTSNREAANSNLENLAIEFATLSPEFEENTTHYETSVPTDMEKLNILAIAKNPNAKVGIQGGDSLEYGENQVKIKVTAENGYTTKTYLVSVHRRTEQEELNWEREQQTQAERLSFVMQEKQQEASQGGKEESQGQEANKAFYINIIIFIVVISIVIIYLYRRNKRLKNK